MAGGSRQFLDIEADRPHNLFELDKTELEVIIGWLKEIKLSDRDRIKSFLMSLSASELQKFVGLTPERRDTLVNFCNPPSDGNPLLQELETDLRKSRLALDEKLKK